jgi:hypothetical protein
MRYWVFDEDGVLLRKFWDKESAQRFLQTGWRLEIQPKLIKQMPTIEKYGEARW